MIESFYGLKGKPFDKSIPSSELWASSSLKELKARLEYLKQNRGLMLLTGEPGVGKTAALRAFFDELNPTAYLTIYTPLSTVSVLDFYRQLHLLLGGFPKYKKTELFLSIQQNIRDYVHNKKKLPAIILDEAHSLSNESLFELQIITNFEMDSLDPLLLILSGQSHLRERLHRQIHESINQRFRIKFHMTPLEREEVKNYLHHHLQRVGRKEPLFTDGAIDAIFQNTAGNPRKINLLALKTMTLGAIEKKKSLSEEEVFKASRES